MNKKPKAKPTAAELEILAVIWRHGPCTVRFINDKLNEEKKVGYTTTLKIMQIMAEKGLLKRDENQRSHLYQAAIPEKETQKILVDRLLDTAFGGSALRLVMQALGTHRASAEEISRIRELLDEMEGGQK